MRSALAGLIITTLTSSAPTVATTARERTWLTGAGIAALGAGVAACTLGIAFELEAADAGATLRLYLPTADSTPAAGEEAAVRRLQVRQQQGSTLGLALLVAAGALVVGGVVGLVLDTPSPVTVGLAPTGSGGVLVFSTRW